jgi:sialic acid synthase SpsE
VGTSPGIASAIQAYSYGARIIEMHYTLNRALKGTDQAFSLEPAGLRNSAAICSARTRRKATA